MLLVQPNHLPAYHRAIIATEQQLVSMFCASADVHVCLCSCVYVGPLGQRNYRNRGDFGIRLSVCSSTRPLLKALLLIPLPSRPACGCAASPPCFSAVYNEMLIFTGTAEHVRQSPCNLPK